MSLQDAQRFLGQIDADLDLQTEIDAANWDSDFILTQAAARGLEVTEAELQTAIDQTWGALTEEELVSAAGGDLIEITVPIPVLGTLHLDPQPGDLTGNTCLFGWKNK